MALSNPESFNFGVSAVRLKRAGALVGQDALIGNMTAELNTGTSTTNSAVSGYPIAMRNTRSEGAGSLTLNDRPAWIDGDVAGGTQTTAPASATAAVGTLSSTNGTTINGTDLTITAANSVATGYDFHIEATASAQVRIRYVSSNGEQDYANVAISDTATEIGSTGVSITGPASPSFTTGDTGEVSVEPPHGGKTTITIPQFRTGRDYEMTIWGAEGGAQDSPEKITFHRVYLMGANFAKTSMEMPQVEVPFYILSPLDGSAIYTREIWQPAA